MTLKLQVQKQDTRKIKDREIVTILGIRLSSTSRKGLLKAIEHKLQKKEQFSLLTPNPEIVLLAQKNMRLRSFLNQADFSLPDGAGLVWASKFLVGERLERIPGRSFFLDLLTLANERHLKVFLLGASPEVNRMAVNKIQKLYPNIKVAGSAGPMLADDAKPVVLRDRKLYFDTLDNINAFKPELLFVAFGAPKQELFLADNLTGLRVGGAMVIGGTLDYFVGKLPLPPGWMAGLGLEWLWRLLQRPQRIGRIFKATVIFPVVVLREKVKRS